jgi:hypothetical protein
VADIETALQTNFEADVREDDPSIAQSLDRMIELFKKGA